MRFKIRRLGHFGFNALKLAEAREFYTDLLGIQLSDTLDFSSARPPGCRRTPATWPLSDTYVDQTSPGPLG